MQSKRPVRFSNHLDIILTEPWNPLGLTEEQVSEGKHVTRAFRRQFPGLPKFTYFDDDSLAEAAERAANDACRRAFMQFSNEDLSEESLEIGRCTSSGRSRGNCGMYTPGNVITVLAASAATASAASASAWNDGPAAIYGSADVTGTVNAASVTPSATSTAEVNESVRKAPKLTSLASAFRWMERRPTLARQNSSTLPMSVRLQRFDSVEQAHARRTGKLSHHQHQLIAVGAATLA
eukprot:CAMPEP_0174719628 /NCGR_PEP_ID=MMETSP1094-20130205/31557_1 /TAXON_ID=156173 /ORGANISM="Chrysochromulina brevifilum, Strain UTEX LB 985" /LENGTH=235 /DNA_ID=CAMNT_0015919959 /DNA_START=79 /DNA_END=786 /DNA_ORIENTATION=-